MLYHQTFLTLPPHSCGIHIITPMIKEAIDTLMPNSSQVGLMHLFLQHTSASLAINENADPDVRSDTEDWLDKVAPADQSPMQPQCRYTLEESDDLPAHFKSMMFGINFTIPLVNGVLGLGMWQGIYLCGYRDHDGGSRKVVITIST